MKVFIRILALSTVAIVLLHGAVPHYHDHELSDFTDYVYHNQKEKSALDQLALAFHELEFAEGIDHTELSNSFLDGADQDTDATFNFFLPANPPTELRSSVSTQQVMSSPDKNLLRDFFDSDSKRGPPVL